VNFMKGKTAGVSVGESSGAGAACLNGDQRTTANYFSTFRREDATVDRDVIAPGLDVPPDRGGAGDDLDVGSKGFDDDGAAIVDGFEGPSDAWPVGVIAAGRAAIAAARVEMAELPARLPDCGAEILFLDVHMERVEMKLHGRRADRGDQTQALFARVEEIRFEAIQRLNAKRDTFGLSVTGEGPQIFHHGGPFLAPLAGGDCVCLTDDRIKWTDERGAAHERGLIDQRSAVGHGGFLFGRSAAKIPPRSHGSADAHDREASGSRGGLHRQRVDVPLILDGDFHRIEAPAREPGEEPGALGRERGGMEEGVEA